MCGIAVVLDAETGGENLVSVLGDMDGDLSQRGPDGKGWLFVDSALQPYRFERQPQIPELPPRPVWLGAAFRRLAIRDTRPQADQPLSRRGGKLWVLHNGEIYNDAELRGDLQQRGATFTTTNDAETVIAAYETWGDGCFERLRGMWATVIVDLTQGRIVLSRDRLGIKPLFYAQAGARTLIASHARTVGRALAPRPLLDRSRWHRFLQGLPADHAESTFFAGVRAVPAGSILSLDLRARPGSLTGRRYWSLEGYVPDPRDTRSAAVAEHELRGLLESSTREHLIADRTVGCLLSGGLDSSVIASLAARETRGGPAPMCFSIVFDDPRMSEWPYMQAVAADAGITVVTHKLAASEAWTLVDRVVAAQGEPLLGQDTIAHYRAFQLAHDHGCVVVLEGQGADELFAGLPLYEGVMFQEWLRSGAWRTLVAEAGLRAKAQHRSVLSGLKSYVLAPPVSRWLLLRRRYDWLDPEEGEVDVPAPAERPVERSADSSRLNRYLFNLVRHTNLPSVLQMQDRNAMAHGVENRPPFLDHRVVEWAFRLPSSHKVGAGRRKRVLWDVGHGVVPSIVLARRDKRAIISRNDWLPLRTQHRETVAEMAASPALRQAPGVRGDRMSRFVHAYLRGEHDDHMAVWRLYTGWRWLERFNPS